MMSSQILWQLKKGDKIAQLLLLPYISINSSNNVQTDRFDSTNQKQSLWTSLVSKYAQPNINIKVNGKRFSGLLDTGSNNNITIFSKHLWPKSWPIQKNLLPNCRNFSYQSTRNLSKCSNLPMLLLSRFSRVRLCATPETAAH